MVSQASSRVLIVDATVIIPVFNRKTVVLDALESIAQQTLSPRQVVIVDDGSTDGSADAVSRWIDQRGSRGFDPSKQRICLYRRPKQTAAAARQYGMTTSDPTEFVAFLDSDDLWPNDFLERAISVMSADANVVATSADRRYTDGSDNVFRSDDSRPLAKSPIEWVFRHGGGIASCSVFRRAAIDAAGGWNHELESGEDATLFSTVATLGSWRHLPGAAVTFRHGNAAVHAEESNLSRKHTDSFRRWAVCYEGIYDSLSGRYRESQRRRLRRYIAAYWYRAGKQLQASGNQDAAVTCYDNAVRWRPLMLRPRIRRRRLPMA